MEGILLAFIISFICIVFAFEMAAFASCGWFIPNDLLNEALDKHIPNGIRLNMFDDDIINIGGMHQISTLPGGFFGKYYVLGVGRVFRFSSAHKRIKRLHIELKFGTTIKPKRNIRKELNID
jgi:hypothetical protein